MPCTRGCCDSPADHYRSVGIAAAATPTRRASVTRIDERENGWHRDIPAYRRMRKAGLKPKHVDGAAEQERRLGG